MENEEPVCCWTCKHLRLDMTEGYICPKKGKLANRQERFKINKPTDCKDWERD